MRRSSTGCCVRMIRWTARRSRRYARTTAPRSSGARRSPATDALDVSACSRRLPAGDVAARVGAPCARLRAVAAACGRARADHRDLRRLGSSCDPPALVVLRRAVSGRCRAPGDAATRGVAVLRGDPDLLDPHLRSGAGQATALGPLMSYTLLAVLGVVLAV